MKEHRPGYGVTIPKREDRAWAAGLFEGEGCFSTFRKESDGHVYQYPRAQMNMTDEDAIRRFHSVVGIGSVSGPHFIKGHPERKPLWRWGVLGHAKTQFLAILLWDGLCSRRRSKASEVLLLRPVGRVA